MPEERSASRISQEENNFSRPSSRTENTYQGSERLQGNSRTGFNFNQTHQRTRIYTNSTNQQRSSNQPVPGTSGWQSHSPNLSRNSPVPQFSRSSPTTRQPHANVRIPSTSSNFSHVAPQHVQSGGFAQRSTPPMRNSTHPVPETSRAPSYSQNSARNTPVAEYTRSSPLDFNENEPVSEDNVSEFYVGYRDPRLCPRMMFSDRFDMRRMQVTRDDTPDDRMNLRLLDADDLETEFEEHCVKG